MMNIRKTTEQTLHIIAVETIAKSRRSVERALPSFLDLVSGDPRLIIALVGEDALKSAALKYLQETLSRDMDGGGIGLNPIGKNRRNVVPDDKENYTTVREHPRLLPGKIHSVDPESWSKSDILPHAKTGRKAKAPYVAPKERVSAEAQLKTKNLVASSILDTLIVRGKAIGKWRKEEALELSEKLDWDGKVLKAFADPLPPGALVEEYITVREAEQIMKTLESTRAA
jgi:hypothetical protein